MAARLAAPQPQPRVLARQQPLLARPCSATQPRVASSRLLFRRGRLPQHRPHWLPAAQGDASGAESQADTAVEAAAAASGLGSGAPASLDAGGKAASTDSSSGEGGGLHAAFAAADAAYQQQLAGQQPPDGQQQEQRQQQGEQAGAAAAAASRPAWMAGEAPSALAALAAFARVLGDALRVLLRLLLVEPLSWLLNRSGLLAIRAADVVQQLRVANAAAPLPPDRLAAALRLLNKHHPRSTVEFVELHCLAAAAAAEPGGAFAVNAAVVREYLSALVATGRLGQYGDAPDAPPGEGQSHRSLARLLAELQAAAGGAPLPEAPGATLARPLHVVVQAQEKAGGPLAWLSSFFWSCAGVAAVMYVMTAGAAAMRRLQGPGALQAGAPGASAGVAAPGAASSMFAAKEYSKENLPERSIKKFSDVKGCDEAIAELQEIVEYLKSPDKFTRLGGRLPKGVLLTGPPGTGKTLLARAVAGEAGVPFFYKAGSEFDEMFVGVGSRRVRSLFAAAKKKAPCIIFIDEIDAMGGKRTNWESSGGSRKTLNQLLTDMDGFEENSGVVVVAATNLPELLDPALTRPGRFDRQVAVGLPDVRGRQQILELYLKGKPLAADVDADLLARRTPGFSGAELANLVNEGALLAARHGADAVSAALLDEARDKILMGSPRAITQSEEARRLTAYHEGGHALVALYTPGAKPIHKATIVPRGHALGMVSQVPDKDEYSTTRQQMRAHIDVCMGGKAAEELVFGRDAVTSGATSDLRQATRMARHMVVDCGMSDAIGPVAVGEEQSPTTRQAVDAEVAEMLKAAYQRVVGLLKEREGELHRLAAELLRAETLTLAEIKSLLSPDTAPELPGGSDGGGGGGGGWREPGVGPAADGGAGDAVPAPAASAASVASTAPPAA